MRGERTATQTEAATRQSAQYRRSPEIGRDWAGTQWGKVWVCRPWLPVLQAVV
jgi:hypothetical protein